MNGRSVFDPQWNPGTAWAKSLPLALGIAAGLWILGGIIVGLFDIPSFPGNLALTAIIVAYSVVVHLVAYALVGLPIFAFGGTSACEWIWRMPIALLLGALAGVVPFVLLFPLIGGAGMVPGLTLFMLAIYGLVTGFAAYLQRPPD